MNTSNPADPKGPETLVQTAAACIDNATDPNWPNGLAGAINALRAVHRDDLATEIVNAIVAEGNSVIAALTGLKISILLNRWPMVPDTRTRRTAAQFVKVAGSAIGWYDTVPFDPMLGLECLANPNRTGRGPDGVYNTADDYYTQVYTAQRTLPRMRYMLNGRQYWAGNTGPWLTSLQAIDLNLLAMRACTVLAGNTAAQDAITACLQSLDLFKTRLDAIASDVQSVLTYTEQLPWPYVIYYPGGVWLPA